MSTSQDIAYTCPYCGKQFEITVWHSVNGDKDPDLRERAVSGDLFVHSCPHCHKDFMIQNVLLYTDAVNKFAICLSANDVDAGLRQAAGPLAAQGWKLRRCATLKEFTEKIGIFEDGLDDVAVELAKYDSFIEFLDSRKGNAKDVTAVEYQKIEEGIIKINVRTDDQGMSFLTPMDTLLEEMKVDADLFALDETTFPCVNGDWIISLYTESSGRA